MVRQFFFRSARIYCVRDILNVSLLNAIREPYMYAPNVPYMYTVCRDTRPLCIIVIPIKCFNIADAFTTTVVDKKLCS
jgi:hypothetical protein